MLRGVPKMKPSSRLVSHLLRTSALGVSLAAAAALAAPAFAQDAAAADRPAPQADPYDDSGIIIVTAQGRAPALSDVPVAISAVGAVRKSVVQGKSVFVGVDLRGRRIMIKKKTNNPL